MWPSMSTSSIISVKSVFSCTSTRNLRHCKCEISQGQKNFDCFSISTFLISFHNYRSHRNCKSCGLISWQSTIFYENPMILVVKRYRWLWANGTCVAGTLFVSIADKARNAVHSHSGEPCARFSSTVRQSCSCFTTGARKIEWWPYQVLFQWY